MKRYLFSFLLIGYAISSMAQAPKGINYQGVARDPEGKPLTNKTISVKISILKDAANGEVEYSETHKPLTNQFGLFTLVIGQGTVVTGNFAFISWALGNKWLQVEIDPNGGSAFVLAGSQQLMTVPYAFYAEYSGNGAGLTPGQGISINSGVISNTGDNDSDPSNELQNLGDVLTKGNDAAGTKITNVGAPTSANDAATKNYVDAQNALDLDQDPTNELQTLSQVLTKGNDAGGKKITNLSDPTVNSDAATKNYVDTKIALDLDQDPNNELQTLGQVLTRGTDAGGKKITNLAAPTANTDATTKQYVDNAIATNYAFKVPYTYTNGGTSDVNLVMNLGAKVFDDFNVIGTNRFVAPADGVYIFFVDGTLTSASMNVDLRVNGSTVYPVRKQDVIVGINVYINNMASVMLKLTKNDYLEVLITSYVPGDKADGFFFGYKL
jgi:hypothetical protein